MSDLFLMPLLLQWRQVTIVCLLLPAVFTAQHPAFLYRHEPPAPHLLIYLPASSLFGLRDSCVPDGLS